MKKIILMLLMIATTSATWAQKEQSTLSDVTKKAGELYDSSKSIIKNGAAAIGNGLHEIDTSSLSKSMYHDFKNGITAMAETLKVGAEHVYKVLCMQQVVNSITWLVIVLALIGIPACYFKKMRTWAKENDDEFCWAAWVISTIIPIIIGSIMFICTANTIIGGFINPEYGAMKDIVDMASKVKNGTTQCQSCGR